MLALSDSLNYSIFIDGLLLGDDGADGPFRRAGVFKIEADPMTKKSELVINAKEMLSTDDHDTIGREKWFLRSISIE